MQSRRTRVARSRSIALLGLSACLLSASCGGSADGGQPPGVPALYGDGSAGNRIVAVSGTLLDLNPQYNDFTVNPGVTLTVRSGTVIRCAGTFTNNGIINVTPGTNGGSTAGADGSTNIGAMKLPHPGCSEQAASNGEFGDVNGVRSGGTGGLGLDEASRFIRIVGHHAGGAGGGTHAASGGDGGGGLTVLAFGPINCPAGGRINADGGDVSAAGGGGGAGGILVLASRTSITVAGFNALSAVGGEGGDSDTDEGPGGGGGGGIVHCISPANTVPLASVNVSGGPFVELVGGVGSVTSPLRSGGGGGGACAGGGGNGGSVSAVGTPGTGTRGGDGDFIDNSGVDPTGLFP